MTVSKARWSDGETTTSRRSDEPSQRSADRNASEMSTAKRAAGDSENGQASAKYSKLDGTTTGIHAILMDIEGTTTPISFVHDKLVRSAGLLGHPNCPDQMIMLQFPYARAHLDDFVNKHWDAIDIQECVTLAAFEDAHIRDSDECQKRTAFLVAMRNAMASDQKLTSLKRLQGIIWKEAYENGEVQGELFDDVPRALRRWQSDHQLYIYSSGSVAAQRLLFGKSTSGDLTPCLRGHFDTTTGPKIEVSSYQRIAKNIAVAPESILFLTDVSTEADAAKAAGLETALLERPGNAILNDLERQAHCVVASFDDVDAKLL